MVYSFYLVARLKELDMEGDPTGANEVMSASTTTERSFAGAGQFCSYCMKVYCIRVYIFIFCIRVYLIYRDPNVDLKNFI